VNERVRGWLFGWIVLFLFFFCFLGFAIYSKCEITYTFLSMKYLVSSGHPMISKSYYIIQHSMAFKVSCYPPCIRSTSVSAISMTSLPTCIAICTIFCNFSGSTPRPAAYPSVNPTDSQSTTFRFLETELSGTVATLYRFVVTKISLGSASKNIV
jgi:hypothetical protein